MRTLRYVAAIAAIFAGIGTAQAQGLILPGFGAPASSWTGIYVGVQGGWAHGPAHVEYVPNDDENGWAFDVSGKFFGFHAGFDYQVAPRGPVIGLDADWNWSHVKGSGVFCLAGVCDPPGQFEGNIELEQFGSTRLRLGWAHDRWLPFISGGIAYARYFFFYDDTDGPLAGKKSFFLGWTWGAGAKFKVHNNVELLAEYRYTDYGWDDFGDTEDIQPGYAQGPHRAKLITHALMFGLSVKLPP